MTEDKQKTAARERAGAAAASMDRKSERVRAKTAELNDELGAVDTPSVENKQLVATMQNEGLMQKENGGSSPAGISRGPLVSTGR